MRISKIAAFVCTVALAGTLSGCSAGEQQQGAENGGEAPAAQQKSKDFDGSAHSDTGAGTMMLRTAGGTSDGGNVPEIAGGSAMTQIEVNTDGMDSSVCTVYVDGMENTTMNAGERTQQTITLDGDALKTGTHTVELVKMDGDVPSVYKKAEYKVA